MLINYIPKISPKVPMSWPPMGINCEKPTKRMAKWHIIISAPQAFDFTE